MNGRVKQFKNYVRMILSTKSLLDELMSSAISLIKSKNNQGPRDEPYGTQAFIKLHPDVDVGRTTHFPVFDKVGESYQKGTI